MPATPPGPQPVPLLGWRANLFPFARDPAVHMRRLRAEHGDVVAAARGRVSPVFAFGARHNQVVLRDPAAFQALDGSTLPMRIPPESSLARLFTGLIQMNGDRHRQQRRLILPALHRGRVAAQAGEVAALVRRRLAGWRAGQVRDLFAELRELTLDVNVLTLLGLDPDREGRRMSSLLERWMAGVFAPAALLLPFPLPGLPYRRLLALSERFEGEVRRIAALRRDTGADAGDVLSMLLRARDEDGERLSDGELVGQVATLFVAGPEVTARALAWTLFLLDQHPAVAAALAAELEGVDGAHGAVERLGELRLLERVVKESLRLLPPVMWWSRVSAAPFELGGYELPAGTHVIVSHFVTHRDAEVFPTPDRFHPGRWEGAGPGPYEYIPFSAGPRACPGGPLAMLQMKLILCELLGRHRLSLLPGTRVDRGGLLLSGPRGGLPMRVHPPDGRFTRTPVHGSVFSVLDVAQPG